MASRRGIEVGMNVSSNDGEKLGKVVAAGQTDFVIEKGVFFPKEYTAQYDEVADVRQGEVIMNLTKDQFLHGGSTHEGRHHEGHRTKPEGETRIPVTEEEMLATKRERETGQVTVRKDVHTEEKEITVPVTKEEVHVERRPVGRTAHPDEAKMEKESVTIPVREEEVEVTKRPVVREEVVVTKGQRQQEKTVKGKVRKEEVDVEEEDSTTDRDKYGRKK